MLEINSEGQMMKQSKYGILKQVNCVQSYMVTMVMYTALLCFLTTSLQVVHWTGQSKFGI